MPSDDTTDLATDLAVAWLSNPSTRVSSAGEVGSFLSAMHKALVELEGGVSAPPAVEQPTYTAAVTARKSLADPNVIISMIDGKPRSTLTKHLRLNGLTADEYRERYGLRSDYPIIAPAYSAKRSAVAKQLGLGRKPKDSSIVNDSVEAPQKGATGANVKRGRLTAAEPKKAAQRHLGSQ